MIGKVTPVPPPATPTAAASASSTGGTARSSPTSRRPSLHEDAPLYRRPCTAPAAFDETTRVLDAGQAAPVSTDAGAELLEMLADTRWVWSQYDHQLFLNTVEGPGGDAAVLRLKHPATGVDTGRGLALTTDGNHRWCAVDPRAGTALTVAESMLNLACVGARPLAVVNCLNFGNPEHPEVMWQLSEAIDGMAEACRAFGIPVIGGNVSLYNESLGSDIDPTPGHRDARRGRPPRPAPARRRPGRRRPPAARRRHPARGLRFPLGPRPWPPRRAASRPRRRHAPAGGRRGAHARHRRAARRCPRHRQRRPRRGPGRDGRPLRARRHRRPGRRRRRAVLREPVAVSCSACGPTC